MIHPPRELLRAYAQGNVDLTKSVLIEAHLALCPRCPRLVAAWQGTCGSGVEAALGDDVEASLVAGRLSDELGVPPFEQIWTAVQQLLGRQRLPGAAAVPTTVLAALPDPAGWRWSTAWSPRVKFALLARDPDTGSALYLSYYGPRSTFPRHRHVGLEENVILAGGYQNGRLHVEAGDWVVGAPGTEHAPTTGPDEACCCLSRIEPPGLRFTGWRRWLLWMRSLLSQVRSYVAPSPASCV